MALKKRTIPGAAVSENEVKLKKLTADNARLREALKKCLLVLSGEALQKSALVDALDEGLATLNAC